MSLDVEFKKKEQRKYSISNRLKLNKSVKINSKFFLNTLKNEKWFSDRNIFGSFISIKTEISTLELNNILQENKKTLCLPIVLDDNIGRLCFKSFKNGEKLSPGKYGVKEPIEGSFYLPEIIFTPCLAYDLEGFRLGYGGGFYDKTIEYFESLNHNFLTVGFAFDDQKIKKVAHNKFDKKLNYILTEKQLYEIL
tara:strand:- start:2267 stop:2848 length:582 start_codon:yes stop_codon:yes gene_type:complete